MTPDTSPFLQNGKSVSQRNRAYSLEMQSEIEENLRKIQIELEAALVNQQTQPDVNDRVEAYMEEVTRRCFNRLKPFKTVHRYEDIFFFRRLRRCVGNLDLVTLPTDKTVRTMSNQI